MIKKNIKKNSSRQLNPNEDQPISYFLEQEASQHKNKVN